MKQCVIKIQQTNSELKPFHILHRNIFIDASSCIGVVIKMAPGKYLYEQSNQMAKKIRGVGSGRGMHLCLGKFLAQLFFGYCYFVL
jgi:hypothetical protein